MPDAQRIRLLFYQACSGFSAFLFIVCNQQQNIDTYNDQSQAEDDDNVITKRSYIFLRKSREEMEEIFASKAIIDILKPDSQVLILKSHKCLEKIEFKEIREY